MAEKLLIFGNARAAEMMYYYFSSDSPYKVAGFTADEEFIRENKMFGLPVIPFTKIESHFPPEEYYIFIAIGYSQINQVRAVKFAEANSKGYRFASYISHKAHIGHGCVIGENCMVGANTSLQPFVKIGNSVIIRENVYIGHDAVIGNNCFISGAAAIAGNVKIGKGSFIGVNATLKDNITIGKECIIGAGVTMLHDAKDREVYMEGPSRKLPLPSDNIQI
jgi:sugar O-acyltransferase (sialic acid O-acetyltransferase NeuD family)